MSLRFSSVAAATLSLVLPCAYVAYYSWSFERWAAAQKGGVCGMPLLGAWGVGALGAAFLSLVAVGIGAVAFLRLPRPRPFWRVVELGFVAIPLVVAGSWFVAVFVWA
jgi:hypothetical protein